jgi:glucose dehydrogenase
VATLGFAYAIFAIWGIGWDIIGKGFLLLMVGIPVFVYMAWRHRSAPKALAAREPAAISVSDMPPLVVSEPGRPLPSEGR